LRGWAGQGIEIPEKFVPLAVFLAYYRGSVFLRGGEYYAVSRNKEKIHARTEPATIPLHFSWMGIIIRMAPRVLARLRRRSFAFLTDHRKDPQKLQ
jgi:hypothetical protein